MDLYYDLATNRLTLQAGGSGTLRAMEQKRGDALPLVLRTYRGTAEEALAGTVEIRFGLKQTLDGELLALADEWTEEDDVYSAVLDLNSAELLAALDDVDSQALLAEITISQDGGTTWVSSQTVTFTVRNDVLKDDDGTPTALPSASDWLSARAVRYDTAQALSSGEQTVARGNIGIMVPGVAVVPASPAAPFVETPAYQGFYPQCAANLNGKPCYTRDLGDQMGAGYDGSAVWWSGSQWHIANSSDGDPDGQSGWYSGENVATPDLVVTWLPHNNEPAAPGVELAKKVPEEYVSYPTAGDSIGGLANDAFGTGTNEDGGRDLTVWNQTRNVFQRVRISGTAGNETLLFIDLIP